MSTLPRPELAPPAHPLERLPEEWAAVLESWGEPKYRGLQVFRWLHQRGVFDAEQMTDLPKSLRRKLADESLVPPLSIAQAHESEDGTRKLLVSLPDARTVETVLIPMKSTQPGDGYTPEDDSEDVEPTSAWVTQCISSQVGCAMACTFCASGIAGFKRHLSAAEIVGQVLAGRDQLEASGERVRNVVFMGMGEPLHNYAAVARALTLLCHPDGLGLSKRRVTVSTSGLVPEIDRLGTEFGGQVQLAISLHATSDERRSEVMPINKKYPLAELLAALKRYPLPKRRRITIEYTLIEGVNASTGDAKALAKLLRGIPVKVNLIPMNAVDDNPLRAPSWETVDAFQETLRGQGVPNFVRRRKGDDIAAACGQLALRGEKKKVRVPLPTVRS
ncbi:23S rRNA (adenine(2503)-C(2))-methyltransferase RlmN [Sandaracinus amylolyticus]|uniref:Probable dual-specificity RNA methyltransferase RlmN n=1 Tax=Sandaracinus amylolyticus TaxID=927083 RepID=A0A0F6W3V4_9BACT|nr:23S rRNA (adenine(2503)-C(2))-methyltransferase RlmN [Sandaracinus amylolyticus]AKF06711.1 Ribosomal RNA large subunit methyltransferase N [Sandaracinus amylolyticus]